MMNRDELIVLATQRGYRNPIAWADQAVKTQGETRGLNADDLERFSAAVLRSLKARPPLKMGSHVFVAKAKPRRSKAASRRAIAALCDVTDRFLPPGQVVVHFKMHTAVYDVTGPRPAFVGRTALAQPDEPAKIVQDGMRLAAKNFVSLPILARKVASSTRLTDLLTARNPILDTAKWYKLDEAPGILGVDVAKDPSWTTIWFTGRHDKATKPMRDLADVDEGDGTILNPAAFDWTPEMYRVIGAPKTMSELLAMWHTLAAAARWNPK